MYIIGANGLQVLISPGGGVRTCVHAAGSGIPEQKMFSSAMRSVKEVPFQIALHFSRFCVLHSNLAHTCYMEYSM